MKNKYYAPSIEEFFVGFEHEVRSFDSEDWNNIKYMIFPKTVYNIGYCNLFDYIKKSLDKDRIRVKYLDSDDIVSLGWKHDPSGERYFELGEYQLYLNIHPIHNITIYDRSGIIFQGTIKNKSELKKVLNMLNIKQL